VIVVDVRAKAIRRKMLLAGDGFFVASEAEEVDEEDKATILSRHNRRQLHMIGKPSVAERRCMTLFAMCENDKLCKITEQFNHSCS
jgi:hypothetical protein